jgi:DNA polymerase III epsilon subunit-like protein
MKEKLESLVVWDLETTGFVENPDARIIEIGAQVIGDGEVKETHKWILNHGIDIPEEITKITGISKEDIDREGVDPFVAMQEFMDVLKSTHFNLTHNGFRFDIPFLEKEYKAIGESRFDTILEGIPMTFSAARFREYLEFSGVDTAVMYKAKKLGLTQREDESFKQFADRVMSIKAWGVKYNVGICCDELGIDRTNITQHRANADVYLTREIFKKMIA